MHIRVVRSGGFTGLSRTYALDSATLSPAAAASVHSLVRKVLRPAATAGGAARATPAANPDAFQYDLEIDDGSAVHRLTIVESPSPSAALELARAVIVRAGSA